MSSPRSSHAVVRAADRPGGRHRRLLVAIATIAVIASTLPLAPAAFAAGNQAVQLDGTDDAIQLGSAGSLGATQFTLELWFKRTNTGAVASTGTGGATSIIPLISKGRSESDGTTVDTNYMLGISTITGAGGGTVANSLAADFEDRTLSSNNNSPVFGATAITQNVWHHAAATFNGSQFCLYLDGALDGTCRATTLVPTADSVQIPAVGTAYNSPTGGNQAAGFFAGQVDEVRIWSSARTLAQIQGSMNQELTSGTGLIGRWGMNEGSGTSAASSVGPTATLVGGATWVAGAPALGGPPPPSGNQALQFNGTNQHVTFGVAPGLGAATFTIETWFNRTGVGVGTSTGGGGIASAIPLVTKGRSEGADNGTFDMNYFLGIDANTGVLVADYEEGANQTSPGLNHPIAGATPVTQNAWHHAAATFDGTTLRLYLDGALDATLTVGANRGPRFDSAQHAGLATAMTTTGAVAGFFAGTLDEARIWNVARSAGDILGSMNSELTSGTGLIGRWGMNEGTGASVGGSVGGINGSAVNSPSWVAGAPALGGGPPPPTGGFGVSLPGNETSYVDLGPNSTSLGATNYTLELWFKRTGTGVATLTGSTAPGLTSVIPLITKGRSQSDGGAMDVNYFLGIDTATNRLATDFEEDAAGNPPGTNHGFIGNTPVPMNVWTHAAVTFNGSVFRLYLNGALDGTSATITELPQANSAHRVGLGTAFNDAQAPDGAFQGVIDEARIWNVARTGAEILGSMNTEVTAGTGLIGRWGMNEGSGTATAGSVGNVNGTLVGGATWAAGAPLDVGDAPAPPVVVAPTDNATNVTLPATLDVTVSDPDSANVDVTFWGREASGAGAGQDFTIMTIPDTQFYSESASLAPIYDMQTQWIVSSQASLNTVFATHLGDIVNTMGNEIEWQRATVYQATLDNAGIKNNVLPGNHDINAANGQAPFYDQYFPPSRYEGFSWYGGYLGDPTDAIADGTNNRLNKDNYELFSAGGMDFLIIHLEHDMPGYAVTWAQNVINAYPNRHVIISTHAFITQSSTRPTSPYNRLDGTSAEAVWQTLIRPNCQVFMVVNGHYHGEGRITENNSCGQPVFQLNSDYQGLANGGNGYLRYYTFKPSLDRIDAFTYSPWLNGGTFQTDADSQFSLNWNMDAPDQFTQIGTVQDVASGAHATFQWNGLDPNTEYEWYAVASDGSQSTDGPTSSFTTEVPPASPPVIDSVTINQATPRTNDTLTLNVQSHDVNNDPITYQYQWTKNGSNIAGATAATLNLATAGNGDKGDVIRATVTANDGSANSLPVTSAPVTILNTAPTATVGLSPSTPRPTQTATATATRVDADGDAVTLTYVWKLNGATVKTTAASSSLTDTIDLSTTTAANGDVLRVEVTPNDGTTNGTMVSATATVDIPMVSPIPDSTFQANGERIYSLVRVGNTIYMGGEFTQLLGHNGEIVFRQNIAAVNATTGQPLPWDPNADGVVYSIAASPDGSTIYAAGQFRHVGGLVRTRIVAIDAATGAVRPWNPTVGSRSTTILAIGNRVYIGGIFTTVAGQGGANTTRNRLAAFDATTGALTTWNPNVNQSPRDMLVTPDGRIIVVGSFTTVGGTPSNYIASLDATTGALLPWSDHPVDQVQGITQGPGQIFIGDGTGAPPGNQVVAYNINTGVQQWLAQGDGDVTDVAYMDGVLYAGGHFDAMSGQPRGQIAAFNPATGALRDWGATVDGSVAVHTMIAAGGKLYVGGGFGLVTGVAQQDYAVFSGPPAPNTPPVVDSVVIDQTSPGTNATLSATVAAHDNDGNTLTYTYQWSRNGTDIVGANGPTLDMSVANRGDKGDLIRLRVTVSDGTANSPAVTSAPVTVANTTPTATVALSTQSPGTNTTLTATATRSDADSGDTVSLTYLWTVNGTTRQTTTTTSLTDTFDLSLVGNGDPGDTVVVTVTPNDGTANGTGVSATATVATGATPPIFADEFANLNAWVNVTRITIDNAIGSPGAPSARAVASNQSAFAYRDLGTSTMTPCVSVNVNVASGTGQDLFRLRSASNGPVIKVFVHANGTLQLRADFGGTTRASTVQVGTGWHSIELCGTVGSNTTWDLIRDGVVIINDWVADTGTLPVNRVQIGDTALKTFTENFDHVRVDLVPGEGGGGGDTQGPTTPGTPTGNSPSNGTIQISWAASTDASPPITYRVYRDGNPTSIGQTTSLTFTDPGLTPGTSHTYRVDAVDSLNNPSLMSGTSASILVTGGDTQGPTTPGTPTGNSPSNGTIQISWSASTDASPPITYRIYRDGNPTSVGQTTSTSFNDPGLTPGTSHTYTVDAVDSLNNPSLMSGTSASITVSGPPDTQGPTTPGTPTGSSPSAGMIQIQWTASSDASPPITYRVYRDGNPTSIGQTTSLTFMDPGLTPGTSHTYTVDAVDSLNNPSLMSGTSASILVSAPADTQGPTTPGTPTGSSPSAGMIQIQWTASSDASPPITYRIYRDGNPTSIGQTTSLTFMDPGLTPATSHTYTVDAVDSLNNPSLMSGTSASIVVSGGPPPAIFADGFGTADFSAWTSVTRLTIDNAIGSPAAPSARAQVTNQSAFAFRDLTSTTMTPCLSLNVNVVTAPLTDLFRLRTLAGGPVIKVFVASNGTLQLRSDFAGTTFNSNVQVGTGWHSIELCGTVGSATGWNLYRDGNQIVSNWVADTGTTAVGRVQIGDNAAKTFTVNFDNIRLDQVVGG